MFCFVFLDILFQSSFPLKLLLICYVLFLPFSYKLLLFICFHFAWNLTLLSMILKMCWLLFLMILAFVILMFSHAFIILEAWCFKKCTFKEHPRYFKPHDKKIHKVNKEHSGCALQFEYCYVSCIQIVDLLLDASKNKLTFKRKTTIRGSNKFI